MFRNEGLGLNGETDSMEHEPCRLLGNSQGAVKLITGDTILAAHHKPDSGEPLLKGNRGVLEHSADLERELLLGMVPIAAVQAGFRQIGDFLGVAARAAHNFIQPADRNHEFAAVLVVAEELDGLLQGFWCFHAQTVA
jgi:hypothetical protein